MTSRVWENSGLFLATFAAFALALGVPQAARAANEPASSVDQTFRTPEGKAALARTGLTEASFKDMLAKLSPEQRATVEKMLAGKTPKDRLTARMLGAGYSPAEAAERIALLSDDEIVRLAHNPDGTVAGADAATAVFVLSLILVALLVIIYYTVIEKAEPAPGS